jgi:hypothetical protein
MCYQSLEATRVLIEPMLAASTNVLLLQLLQDMLLLS